MIDVLVKICFQMNDVAYTYYIILDEAKSLSNMQKIACSSSFPPCKNR